MTIDWKTKNHYVECCGRLNKSEEVKRYIDDGHDVNIEDGIMLHEAVRNQCYENVKLLVEAGAHLNPTGGGWKEIPLQIAKRLMEWHRNYPEAYGKEDSIKIYELLNRHTRKQKIDELTNE